jgi:uncharacterized protein YjiS (DUF1127 family)
MSILALISAHRSTGRWWSDAVASCIGSFQAARNELARRRAIRDLRCLDDRMLKDVGISRSDIEAVVCGFDRIRPVQS